MRYWSGTDYVTILVISLVLSGMAFPKIPLLESMGNGCLTPQTGRPTDHAIGWPSCLAVSASCDALPSHSDYCISIFFGCISGRFFIATVRIPFSILAVRVARSALSGISALMA